VMDPHGFEYVDAFTINLLNVVEDLDGDEIEDHYDLDDDGDGFSDVEELAYPSDPRDPNSVANVAPDSLILSNAEILENQPAGSLVGILEGTDPDGGLLTYHLYEPEYFLAEIDIQSGEGEYPSTLLPFILEENGTLSLSRTLDFETDERSYPLFVEVVDEHGFSLVEEFTIDLLNEIEDLDGDGEEDYYDLDDDGDGFSDEEELDHGLDPRNPNNRPELPIAQTLSPIVDVNGSYRLRGKFLSKGGVPLIKLGFILSAEDSYSKEYLFVDTNISEGSDFSFLLVDPQPGQKYAYKAFAFNLAGEMVGAPRKFETEFSDDWWYGADELEGGWKMNWMGTFLPQTNGWVYHMDLGWAYVSPDGSDGLWFWVEDLGWQWTREDVWPFMWAQNNSDWLYLMKSGNRVILYDYLSESFIIDF